MNESYEIKQIEPFNPDNIEESNSSNEKKLSRRNSNVDRSARPNVARSPRTKEEEDFSPIVFGGGSRFNLPISVVKKLEEEGKVAAFVMCSSMNEEQKENYFNAVDRKWKPLDAREHPELRRNYELSPFGDSEQDHLVKKGGQIAMVRDKRIHDAETMHYDSEKQRQEFMASTHRTEDPRTPRVIFDHRQTPRF